VIVQRPRAAYWFVAPALAAIGLFFLLPVAAAVLLSVTDFDIYAIADRANLRWVGGNNYVRLAHDPLFWTALRNTTVFVAVAGPLSIAAALAVAVVVNARSVRWKGFWRTVFFLPAVTTLVAVALVWRYIYHPRVGVLGYVLGLAGIAPIDWLGDPTWALAAIIVMALWKNVGFNMVILLAGLQNIPERLYEAACIDGAPAGRQLGAVTLPMLAPTLVFVAVMTVIGYFQLFAEPYVMTGGGPANSTLSIVLLMYEEGFRWWNIGPAAAIAFVLFLIILLVTALTMRWRRST